MVQAWVSSRKRVIAESSSPPPLRQPSASVSPVGNSGGMKRPAEEESAEKAGARALERYEVGDILGEGSFACVRLAVRKRDGLRLAMKLIDGDGMSAEEVEKERSILSLLGMHRHIVSLVEHFVLPEGSVFVMELADGGEVFERICERGAYSEADAASVVRQVALALAFIHSLGVAHRDLKPENLLLTSNDEVKVPRSHRLPATPATPARSQAREEWSQMPSLPIAHHLRIFHRVRAAAACRFWPRWAMRRRLSACAPSVRHSHLPRSRNARRRRAWRGTVRCDGGHVCSGERAVRAARRLRVLRSHLERRR